MESKSIRMKIINCCHLWRDPTVVYIAQGYWIIALRPSSADGGQLPLTGPDTHIQFPNRRVFMLAKSKKHMNPHTQLRSMIFFSDILLYHHILVNTFYRPSFHFSSLSTSVDCSRLMNACRYQTAVAPNYGWPRSPAYHLHNPSLNTTAFRPWGGICLVPTLAHI